ncbi:open rectifier potassium channel protein 1 [Venturia canescens]|uniref:open rectifier potassium channel protein 1 n=1 Tax=Venturia canescens TaxID=32260 RepID=UPI001C9BCF24|nr:open rectifier potassium channel protein 1 [Venturia canescens]XP_043285976.1 open rectifier potassium channel protein 1 [Venturia canescens]
MSKRQWMVLLMLFLTYLLLGASIFYHIESQIEIENVAKARQERIEINALLDGCYDGPEKPSKQHEILQRLSDYCGKSVYSYAANESDPLKWDFYNSFYFAYTVVSTIGYGNLAPTTMLSRILMIFYGVVGIPMNGILLAQLGEFFGLVFVRAHKKYKSYKQHSSQNEYSSKRTPLEKRKAGLAMQILMYLIPGFVMFIFFPAFVFSHFEKWTYEEAVYYAFVTLTTIGFGDFVAGQDNTKGSGVLFILYKSFLIAWISFGLGYIVMIMTFIATGMRSKKIVRLEHKLAMNLKHTQSKIWNEFNKEVGYLRRVFNELQLSKVKPIYVDEYDYEAPAPKFQRSNSFPDLRDLAYGGLSIPTPPHPRRRANSEVVPVETSVARVVSETDLQRIDKNATFATHAMVQPAELLARLVNILGYIPPPPDDGNDEGEQSPEGDSGGVGVQGFSEKEILSSEKGWNNSKWKLGGDSSGLTTRTPRSRAASEVRLDPKFDPSIGQEKVEWTWSGPSASRKIQEIIKARRNGAKVAASGAVGSGGKESKSKFPNLALPLSVPKTLLPRWIKQLSNKKENSEARSRNSVSGLDLEACDNETYLTQPPGSLNMGSGSAGFSTDYDPSGSSSRPYFTHTGAANLASSLEGSNLLEETSLADFLRALTALHTRVAGAVPEEYVKKPQRKMGTASLTPPKLPSLLSLFSPLPGSPAFASQSSPNTLASSNNPDGRRFSLRLAENSGNSTPAHNRRSSFAHPAVKPRRRFSLRPVVTPLGSSPLHGSPYLSGINPKDRSGPQTPPPVYNSEGFLVECPKDLLVEKEGAPGVSSPITSSIGVRRFSLRPAETTPQGPQGPSALTKGLPRWRAGMLQRQINQIHLQSRVRAFSLSDVNTEGSRGEKSPTPPPISPLVDGVRILGGTKDQSSKSSQKTVTIVSPRSEEMLAPKSDGSMLNSSDSDSPSSETHSDEKRTSRSGAPILGAISANNDPFAFFDDDASPAVATNAFVFKSKPGTSGAPDDLNSRTIYQALQSVKSIETGPRSSDDSCATDKTIGSGGFETPSKKQSISSCSTATTDTKSTSRRASPISIGAWTESRRNDDRKNSNVSQPGGFESVASSSRKSSTNKNANDKPRVSIDSYKPLMEVKIEKPSEDPFERYRATMKLASVDNESLIEVKTHSTDSDEGKNEYRKSRDDRHESDI